MIDKKLESTIKLHEEYIELWNKFFSILEEGLSKEEYDEKLDEEFIQVKTKLAYRKQILLNMLGKKVFNEGIDIIKVLTMAVSLYILRDESIIKVNNIKNLWHEVFISLRKHAGNLKHQRDELSHISPLNYKIKKIKENPKTKYVIIAIAVVIVVAVIIQIVDFQNIGLQIQRLLPKG